MNHIVNFSGGRSSAYMVYLLKKENPNIDFKFIFCNTSKETKETYEFINECDKYFNMNLIVLEYMPRSYKITTIDECFKNGEVFEKLIEYKKMQPNVTMRFCTTDMKINIVKRYLRKNKISNYMNYLGIRVDEPQRYSRIINRNTKNVYNDMPLFYNQITKEIVNEFWKNQPFDLKHNSILGNCDLCFLKRKSRIINILTNEPKKADWWIKQEKNSGHTFKRDISYKTMLELSKNPQLDFSDDNDIDCECNLND